jgi:NADP-dependent 3-hydroxy acid dehydrogenase YdfG
MNITSEVVAISGAAGRIGSNLVRYLLEKNFRVIAGDINKKKINSLKKEIDSENVCFFLGDLTKYRSIDNFIKTGVKNFGEINSAINCAYPKEDSGKRFEDIKQNSLNNNIVNHLGGAIIFAQRFTKYFLKNKRGNLIKKSDE